MEWFDRFEWPFVMGNNEATAPYLPDDTPYAYGSFSSTPEGDCVEVARKLFKKYFKNDNIYVQRSKRP